MSGSRTESTAASLLICAGAIAVVMAAVGAPAGALGVAGALAIISAAVLLWARRNSRRSGPDGDDLRATDLPTDRTTVARPFRDHGNVTDESRDARPMLSIVMPVYNVGSYLESALLSVLYQDFQDFELIVVDDASTDASSAILGRYSKLDPRIRIVTLAHNSLGGAGIPSNIGIRAARGKYLGFADSDDVVMRGAFSKLIALAERESAEVVIGGFATFTDDDHIISEAYDLARVKETPRNQLISATTNPEIMALSPVPWRKLYRMSFMQQFGIEYPEGDYFFEDNPLHWAVLSAADRVVLSDEIVSHHRMGRAGQTMDSMAHLKGAFAHHMSTSLASILATSGERRDALLEAFVDRLYASRWVIRQQEHTGAQAMLAKRFGTLFDDAVAAGARIPIAMRRSVGSYRGSYPAHDLTIVMTAHNVASKVKRTLDSLLATRRIVCDIIVVDDGSTDETLSVIREYESAHSNVHVFTQPHRGAGRARNSVIPLITGRFALFLLAGDMVNADELAACVTTATEQRVDLLFFGSEQNGNTPLAERLSLNSTTSEDISGDIGARRATATHEAVAWNRLIRTVFLHENNIFFGGSFPYEDLLYHWHTVTLAQAVVVVNAEVVERQKFTRKRVAASFSSARGYGLHDALWFTWHKIRMLANYEALQRVWLQQVSLSLATARYDLSSEETATFDEQSEALWQDLVTSEESRPQEEHQNRT